MRKSRHHTIQRVCYAQNPYAQSFALDPSARSARMALIATCLGIFAIAIITRLAWVQGAEQQRWQALAQNQYQGTMNILGARGSIFDRHQRSLATSAETLAVGIHPHLVADKMQVAHALARHLDLSESEVREKLDSTRPFVWLAKEVDVQKRTALKAIAPRALSINSEFSRFYPQGVIASALLGKVGVDGDGLSGIELAYNSRLKAEKTLRNVGRDALGNYFRPASARGENRQSTEVRSEGNDITLTIDAVLQGILEKEVARGRLHAEARSVFATLMDADTGEILAAAEDTAETTTRTGSQALRSAILQNSYEPGSTFKPLVAAAALDGGFVNPNEVLDCTKHGRMRVGKHTIRDVHPVGKASLRDVLVRSSNICMAQIGARMGAEHLHGALVALGFGKQTGIELQGEAKGILRDAQNWRRIDVATASFGQGIATTSLQLVRAYAALANGGYLVQPRIVVNEGPAEKKRVLRASSAAKIKEMISGVVQDENGTARLARIAGITVYGKTGTAQKPSKTTRGYDPNAVLSSFIGFVDGQEVGISSRLVLYVAVDEPQVKPRWGGRLAAPVFRRSMERILSHLISTQATIALRQQENEDRLARETQERVQDIVSG